MTKKTGTAQLTPEAQLRSFIARRDPAVQKLFRAVRTALRKRLPTANELAYDYTSHVVIAYGPTDRGIDAIVSIAGRSDGVRLYFAKGPELADPGRRLLGSGKQTRYIELTSARQLAEPEVEALLRGAIRLAGTRLSATAKPTLTIRGAAASARPRPKRAG